MGVEDDSRLLLPRDPTERAKQRRASSATVQLLQDASITAAVGVDDEASGGGPKHGILVALEQLKERLDQLRLWKPEVPEFRRHESHGNVELHPVPRRILLPLRKVETNLLAQSAEDAGNEFRQSERADLNFPECGTSAEHRKADHLQARRKNDRSQSFAPTERTFLDPGQRIRENDIRQTRAVLKRPATDRDHVTELQRIQTRATGKRQIFDCDHPTQRNTFEVLVASEHA